MCYLELKGLVGSVPSSQRNRELKLNFFGKLNENNIVICLQEVHGKNEFLQAIQVWAPRFRLFGNVHSWKRKRRRIGHMHPQGPSALRMLL